MSNVSKKVVLKDEYQTRLPFYIFYSRKLVVIVALVLLLLIIMKFKWF